MLFWGLWYRHPCLHVFENGEAVQPRMAAPHRLLGSGGHGPWFGSSGLDCALKYYSKLNGLQRLWQEIIGAKLNGFRVKMEITQLRDENHSSSRPHLLHFLKQVQADPGHRQVDQNHVRREGQNTKVEVLGRGLTQSQTQVEFLNHLLQ